MKQLFPKIVCKNGLTFSAQASSTHYCSPCSDCGPYAAVECGYPSRPVEKLMEVWEVVQENGGFDLQAMGVQQALPVALPEG